jgi:hypothetical protein
MRDETAVPDGAAKAVRAQVLRRLAACELGLAAGLHALGRRGDRDIASAADRLSHDAGLLAERARELGVRPRLPLEPDPLWRWRDDRRRLLGGVHEAIATFHDQLIDFDAETIALVCGRILPSLVSVSGLLARTASEQT